MSAALILGVGEEPPALEPDASRHRPEKASKPKGKTGRHRGKTDRRHSLRRPRKHDARWASTRIALEEDAIVVGAEGMTRFSIKSKATRRTMVRLWEQERNPKQEEDRPEKQKAHQDDDEQCNPRAAGFRSGWNNCGTTMPALHDATCEWGRSGHWRWMARAILLASAVGTKCGAHVNLRAAA